MHSVFITFEGGDGGGKSTQLALLAEKLRGGGVDLITTREPGGPASPSPDAVSGDNRMASVAVFLQHLRELSLHLPEMGDMTDFVQLMLMNAGRAAHCEQIIQPALSRGVWVLCDRFFDSTQAYQGDGVNSVLLELLNAEIAMLCCPDLTFILDIDPALGLKRRRCRAGAEDAAVMDHFEHRDLDFHARVRVNYLELAALNEARCVVIDASLPKKEVARLIWREAVRRFSLDHASFP